MTSGLLQIAIAQFLECQIRVLSASETMPTGKIKFCPSRFLNDALQKGQVY
jgi:hypothetical protein